MKNERRKWRRRYVVSDERFAQIRDAIRWEMAETDSWQMDASFDELLIDLRSRRCTGCGGRGWKERRHKPYKHVPCRVCQGLGSIEMGIFSGKIKARYPSKVYWHRRPWTFDVPE